MSDRYNPQEIEPKWQKIWEEEGLYRTVEDPERPKWYALTMLPYPSGDLHTGHWYAFTPSDAAARWRRMNGYNVFFPIGFDAFGLPAENAAIKHGIHPKEWTYANIERMRRQLRQMGAMWAWDREAITCDPEYYKWTQWFFLKFYEAGLAYREYAPVDWCPSCNTTLAREQVWGEDRHCERCGTPVIKKELEQWKFRITRYADELIEGLNQIDWPERVKVMQINWIGRSEGAEVTFHTEQGDPVVIFTTRPDTLWGATFMVLAPEHLLVDKVTTPEQWEEVQAYKAAAARLDEITRTATDKEKTGVFTGGYAINPVNNERIPIWIADYVMMGYGTGAIMAVPAHDQRDFEFAQKFGLEIRRVISGPNGEDGPLTEAYDSKEEGFMINSGPFDGTPVKEAAKKVTAWLEETGKGKAAVNYRLRDWLISRQRMWGAPIPIIYCPQCGTVPVPYEELPVRLPDDAEFKPTGESPLKYHAGFRYVKCPRCGGDAERETDTMDTFMCSSWYHYAYVSPYWKAGETIHADDMPWDPEKGEYWLPVDQYTGGIEHATMHLLYTRFFTKALRDLGIVNFDEPMLRLFNQGTILGPDGEKMSKSRGNVVNPDDYVGKYGADTVRGYLMFIGPWELGGPWDPSAIEGVSRFLHRVWHVVVEEGDPAQQEAEPAGEELRALERKLHQTILKVTDDIANFRFNTAIAAMMELNNLLLRLKETPVYGSALWQEAIETLILLMAPIFPHISEELWHRLGHTESVHLQRWPEGDPEKAREEEITVVVQVNGKVRDKLLVSPGTDKATLESQALALGNVQKWIDGKQVRKVIVVPDRLVNIVVG
ncbi:leucine--tRNA ligase [Litorilinea aerophila]|uniref:Leucine--tRNA ligase n=1 Tax=Litorilinea aerophila TaxID=1204385 RepID=A0A540VIS3_9CHLR|nr:leucine--tRNA ligase [Litorilinea aerophila]MCC9075852.1 leucine--tRNA ligase [Litorilinea aerophila]